MRRDGDATRTSDALDLRLAAPAAAAWLIALLLLGAGVGTAVAVAAAIAVLAVLAGLTRRRLPARWRWAVPASLGCAAAAAASATAHLAVLASGPLPRLAMDRAEVRAELVVTGDPVLGDVGGPVWSRGRTVTVPVDVRGLAYAGARYRMRQPALVITRDAAWPSLVPGQRVVTHGALAPPLERGTLAAVLYARGAPVRLGRPPLVQRVAASLRAGLRDSVSGLPQDERGLVPGLVVGDTSGLGDRVEAEFKRTGLTHLLAVSGANLAIAIGAVLALCRRTGMPRRGLPVAGAAAIAGFVVLARPEPSVLRAAVMGGVALLALGSGRPRRGLPPLFAAVLVLVLAAPAMARSYGFALSVLATLGLLTLAPRWRDRMVERGCPRRLAEAIAVPAAAQVLCGPVVAMLAAQVNLVGVAANLIAAPAVAPVTVLGVVATVVHPVSTGLAHLVGWCTYPAAWWLVHVARTAAALPGASVGWPGGLAGGALLAALTVAVLLLAPYRSVRRVVAAGAAGVLLAGGALHVAAPGWPPSGWRLVACDVGQGDGLVLAAGPATGVVVDTGPDPALMDACLDRLGIRRVPLLLLTHLHADHASGVPGVLRGRAVGAIVAGPRETPAEEWAAVRAAAAAARVPVSHATAGTRWRIGPLALRVLWPPPGTPTGAEDEPPGTGAGSDSDGDSSTENDASLVVRASWPGLTALLTGDVEPPGQQALVAAGADLSADVLKVPHHGSARQEPAFFRAVGARVAVISVGVDNDYGHPAPRTLDLLAATGMRTYRTDRDGDVAVVSSGTGIAVAARGPAAVSLSHRP